jgi:acyl-CoA synthetase (AMP-forming)/AMP-acid ligase II
MTTLAGPPLGDITDLGALTLGGLTEEVAARFGDREALVFDDPLLDGATVRWSYADLRREARRVARAVIAAGLGKGARVGVLMGSRPEAVAALLGGAMAGAVVVPLSTFSPLPELAYLLRHADISLLVTQTRLLDRDLAAEVAGLDRDEYPFLTAIVAVGLDRERDGVRAWPAFLADGDAVADTHVDARIAEVHHTDDATIIYSSGTTDRPKGMLHDHRAPCLQFKTQARVFRRGPDTRVWAALPLFWTAGFHTVMGATLAAGGCWVMQETFVPSEALRLIERERVTEPYTLPHQTGALEECDDWATADLSSLVCVFGKSAFARHPSVTGDTTWIMPVGYGLSEACAIFVTHWWDASREETKASTGRLLPGNELRIVDPDSGAVLGAGEVGEFTLRGPTMMQRYVKVARDHCFDADGFFHTGDVGYYDDDGSVHWTGRRTEMIKTGGANVSPAEIEVQLRAFAPVKLARVVGVPDERLDQLVVLAVVLKEGEHATEADVQQFLRERVASYKVPKRVLFFAEHEMPMTRSATKVRDPELLALVEARLVEPASSSSSCTSSPGST